MKPLAASRDQQGASTAVQRYKVLPNGCGSLSNFFGQSHLKDNNYALQPGP